MLFGRLLYSLMYLGRPPWDLGRPQPAVVQLVEAGKLCGRVLDVGCGAGENSILIARSGCDVVGIDYARTALAKARKTCREDGLHIPFIEGNVLHLDNLDEKFDIAVDSALFHTLSRSEREEYARSLASVIVEGGKLFLICFRDDAPIRFGSLRTSREEIERAFAKKWQIESIEKAEYHTNRRPVGAFPAWICELTRLAD